MALYRVTEYGQFYPSGVETRAVYWLEGGTGLTPEGMETFADDYAAALITHRQGYMHPNYAIYGLGIQQVRPVLLPEQMVFEGFPVVGSSSGEMMPTIIAAVLNLTAYSVKPNRARKYLAGFTESQNVEGTLGVGAVTSSLGWGEWVATYGPPGPGNVYFGAAEMLGEFDYTLNPFNAWTVKRQWGVQRRRRPGTGI